MADTNSHAPPYDVELSTYYAPIPTGPETDNRRRSRKILAAVFFSALLLLAFVFFSIPDQGYTNVECIPPASDFHSPPSRGVLQGVSEKVFRSGSGGGGATFSWSNKMVSWQRTAYHFQPEKNWMNDPNGPLYHKGWYHFFYQYNQDSPVWGNITWGHAVSRDLIHWFHLPHAMIPDQWYDVNGVWTGSATILSDGQIVILYTGDTNDLVQVQCQAYPANLSDPLLLKWVKNPVNPVMVPPHGIRPKNFRDPTTAWLNPGGDRWRVAIGSKINKTGIALVYETSDFVEYELLDGNLHEVPGTGMWECVDFYPVFTSGSNGVDTSVNGSDLRHVMKVSLDDDRRDYYAVGRYDPVENKWSPDDPKLDVGIGLRYDYGTFYASKTFFDHKKERRILWGWITETDDEELDIMKGWAGVQAIPRTILFDQKTGSSLLQWPVREIENLRSNIVEFNVKLEPGTIMPTNVEEASQVDIVASFEIDIEALAAAPESDIPYDCSASGGGANRGFLGPFGIVVLADDGLTEFTPIYFYIAKRANGKPEYHFCADESKSSLAHEVEKVVHGSEIPVIDGEKLTIRSLVDHSIVESFGQGGRRVITSRIYPTMAIDGAARVLLFNNATAATATAATVTASVRIWKMGSADIRRFPFDTEI